MQKRASSCLAFCLLVIACLQAASCTGTPPLFDTVILHATSRQVGPNTKVTITAQVPQDKTNAGVTWVLIPPAPPPADGSGTLTTTLNEAVYTSPVTVTGKFTVTIQATSIAIPAEVNKITITVVPPQTLKITTKSPIAPGTQFVVYPNTQLQATGGVTPYAWSLANGTTLPTGLSLAPDGIIGGTPTVTGTFKFSVEVTDSEVPPVTTPATSLSITITNLLNGNYAFELSGFNASGAIAIAGSFTADGNTGLTNGVEDFNSTSAAPKNQTFTGSFVLQSNNTGTLTFSSLTGSPVFAFAIDSTGSFGRIIEYDSSGIRASGQIKNRSVSSCASNTLSGEYAFGIKGQAIASGLSAAGPVVNVGSFGAIPPAQNGVPGTIGPGEADANTPQGITTQDETVSGTYLTNAQSTRCTMSLSEEIGTMNFSVYPISSSEAFVVETDQVSTTEPYLTSGRLLAQSGYPFQGVAGSTFTIPGASVGGLTGQFLSGNTYIPDLVLMSITGTGSPNYTISFIENQGGAIGQLPPNGLQFTTADSFGRVNSGLASPIAPIFYVVGTNEAFCIGELIGQPFFGLLEPQSGSPFTASALNGNLVLGTGAPATAPVSDISGVVTLANTSATAGTITGSESISASGGNSTGAVTGTYSGLNSSTGAGAIALTAPSTLSGQFLVVSPTEIVVLTTTAGDTDPKLIFLGECTSTCNEN